MLLLSKVAYLVSALPRRLDFLATSSRFLIIYKAIRAPRIIATAANISIP